MGSIGGTSKKDLGELHGRTGLGAFSNGTDLSCRGQHLLPKEKSMRDNLPRETLSQLLARCYLVRDQGPATQSALSPAQKEISRTSLASSNFPTEARYRGESGRNLMPANKRSAGTHWNARRKRHLTSDIPLSTKESPKSSRVSLINLQGSLNKR